ncbi:hypothetical protein EDD85DRAFT_995197 [Armillaria nabsnona]|nr:hypothetical protein EDD85DRAFT_995197 [Armillaria nabsnona]
MPRLLLSNRGHAGPAPNPGRTYYLPSWACAHPGPRYSTGEDTTIPAFPHKSSSDETLAILPRRSRDSKEKRASSPMIYMNYIGKMVTAEKDHGAQRLSVGNGEPLSNVQCPPEKHRHFLLQATTIIIEKSALSIRTYDQWDFNANRIRGSGDPNDLTGRTYDSRTLLDIGQFPPSSLFTKTPAFTGPGQISPLHYPFLRLHFPAYGT